MFGELTADHYEDATAGDERVDDLRAKMHVVEEPRYSREYLEPDKRSIANAIQVFFKDGSSTAKIEVEYPIGHRRRRAEGMPLLLKKFEANLRTQFPTEQTQRIVETCHSSEQLDRMPVNAFVDLFLKDQD